MTDFVSTIIGTSPAPVPIEEITLTLVNINQSDFDDNGLP